MKKVIVENDSYIEYLHKQIVFTNRIITALTVATVLLFIALITLLIILNYDYL